MTGGEYQGVLTDDEAEAVTIIKGLEGEAQELENRVKKAKSLSILYFYAGAATMTLSFLERNPAPHSLEKGSFLWLAAATTLAGITQFVREQRLLASSNRKIAVADGVRQELDPAELGLFDDEFDHGDEDQ